ncbi:aminotransferase class I/II-fold pyridoxal phosphate-dependent enzyme [Promethearchaeum syntrophicum]|uniref:Aminotransferase class I/II-fold pyridoxal phosphate-dependent enzyme n=1 Tax=Promethearchaeum syntrophicum TaxID=2594042 RepID=A0A5B9DAE0_9ARCH
MEFETLKKTPVFEALSSIGKRIYQPNGIFYWTSRAKKEAEINATIGTAVGFESDIIEGGREKLLTYYLPELKQYINLSPEKFASYAPIAGLPTFRDLWEKWIIYKGMNAKNLPSGSIDITGKITKPAICNGITNCIFLISRFFLNPGERIICPNKKWGNYNSVLHLQNELKIESFQFFKESELNVEGILELMQKISETQDKIVLILNFPNNPTGYCPTKNEIQKILNSLKNFCDSSNKPVLIFCDDAYEGYSYSDQRVGTSIFYELIDLHPNLIPIKLDGASKEVLMYGGRTGAITLGIHSSWLPHSEKELFLQDWENKIQGMIRSTISNSNHFYQEVLIEILRGGFEKMEESRKKIYEILKKRYFASINAFNKYKTEGITMDPAGGGFFVFLNIDKIPATNFADHLLKEYKVGTFPIMSEKEEINGIRVAFCSIPLEKIEETFKRINLTLSDLS